MLCYFYDRPDIISSPVIASTFTAAVGHAFRLRLLQPPQMLLYGFLTFAHTDIELGSRKCLSYIADIRGSDSLSQIPRNVVFSDQVHIFSTAVTSSRLLRTSLMR